MNTADALMQMALDVARQGIAAGQSPFGCAIAWNDRLVACTHNTVLKDMDITAHAEINALRAACRATGKIHLPGAIVATTCEPCPMCCTALHWARVETIYYGATIADAAAAGFHELSVPAEELARRAGGQMQLVPSPLAAECRALFELWRSRPSHRAY